MGYDDENIVQMACEMGAEFLDLVLTKVEALGENVNDYAHCADKEGYCAVQLFRDRPEIVEVFLKHNINLEYTRLCPMPWSDVYELFVERRMIENMEKLAQKWHEGEFRKDGVTPSIEHPKKVAQKMLSWQFQPESEGWAVAVAWDMTSSKKPHWKNGMN